MSDPLAPVRRDVTKHARELLRVADKHDAALRTIAEGARDPAIRRSLVEASRHLGAFILGVRGLLLAHALFAPPLDPSGTAIRHRPADPAPARRAAAQVTE